MHCLPYMDTSTHKARLLRNPLLVNHKKGVAVVTEDDADELNSTWKGLNKAK